MGDASYEGEGRAMMMPHQRFPRPRGLQKYASIRSMATDIIVLIVAAVDDDEWYGSLIDLSWDENNESDINDGKMTTTTTTGIDDDVARYYLPYLDTLPPLPSSSLVGESKCQQQAAVVVKGAHVLLVVTMSNLRWNFQSLLDSISGRFASSIS